MSQFANVSPICGICALFKVLMVKYRAKRNHRLLGARHWRSRAVPFRPITVVCGKPLIRRVTGL
jgi:hypothetical protein